MPDSESAVDPHVPHAARIYDYILGGADHFEVDRVAAHAAVDDAPGGFEAARAQLRANRAYLGRVVRYLVAEAGIRQFLDIGTGVPNADNVHAVAQSLAPDTTVVYVDNDPSVLAHARELLAADGATTYVDGDLRYPAKILREARQALDFDRPIAVVLNAILHFLPESDEPYRIVEQLMGAVPSGSYLAISHITLDVAEHAEAVRNATRRYNETTNETWVLRTTDEVAAFFTGLELVEPGVVPLREWRPDRDDLVSTFFLGGVARKP